MALFGGTFLIPLFMQSVRRFGAFETGLTLLPQALFAALCMPLGGKIYDRYGVRPLVIAGLSLVGLATLLLARLGDTTQGSDLLPGLALRGAGMGLMLMSLNTHLLNAAPRELLGRVSALSQALSNVIASLTIAGLATIIQARGGYYLDRTILKLEALPGPPGLDQTLTAYMKDYARAFNEALLLQLGFAVCGILLALTLRRRARG